jgi:hypothetical protein
MRNGEMFDLDDEWMQDKEPLTEEELGDFARAELARVMQREVA